MSGSKKVRVAQAGSGGGRSVWVFRVELPTVKTDDCDAQLIEEVLNTLASNAGMSLRVSVPYGRNSRHVAKTIFKGLANALDWTAQLNRRVKGVPSTRSVL